MKILVGKVTICNSIYQFIIKCNIISIKKHVQNIIYGRNWNESNILINSFDISNTQVTRMLYIVLLKYP